jgi:putative multicomponent Na+:H+ antiporter subunit B
MVMRLGIREDGETTFNTEHAKHPGSARFGASQFSGVVDDIRSIVSKRHMRLELVTYPDTRSLHQALTAKEIHGTCVQTIPLEQSDPAPEADVGAPPSIQLTIRIRRLYDILKTELSSSKSVLIYLPTTDDKASERDTTGSVETRS